MRRTERVAPNDRRRWRRPIVAAVTLAVVAAAAFALLVVLANTNLAPPDIDARPGVVGAMHLEVSPVPADVRIDGQPPQRVDRVLDVRGLDPNRPHRVRASARGYAPFEEYEVIPAGASRAVAIELRPLDAH